MPRVHAVSAVFCSAWLPRRRLGALIGLVAAACLYACGGSRYEEPDRIGPAAPPAGAPPTAAIAPVPSPAAPSAARNLNAYKREVAQSIYRSNAGSLFEGPPPAMLKSIIVLSIGINRDGRPVRLSVLRSNGYPELERIAVESVRRAAPLPSPGAAVVAKNGLAEYAETWLFRDDGRFQIRSLAEVQANADSL
jgi:protein TonB